MNPTNRSLKSLLRVIGAAALLAVFAVVMPCSWMDAIRRRLGMGKSSDQSVVEFNEAGTNK